MAFDRKTPFGITKRGVTQLSTEGKAPKRIPRLDYLETLSSLDRRSGCFLLSLAGCLHEISRPFAFVLLPW